jgi:predicted RNase H-like nuclease (RuvC/YqgF family)
MRIGLIILCLSSFSALAQNNYGYLKPEDQKYFKNDSLDGKNKWERIDANVAEINRLHGTIAEMKLEIQKLKTEVEELKKKK